MAAVEELTKASRLPGPPELLPGKPDAVVDLQTPAGTGLVAGEWRYADARVEEIDFVALGSPEDPLGPGSPLLRKILRTHWIRTLLISGYAMLPLSAAIIALGP